MCLAPAFYGLYRKNTGDSVSHHQSAALPRPKFIFTILAAVPVDPADVRKVVHEPGNRPLDDEMVRKARTRLFGSWEMNWMAFNFAHDVALPGSSGAPVGFLMYPQAETSAGSLDCLDADHFNYEIAAKQLS